MNLRTIITQDAEVDDQNSLRHHLLYTNEVELKGIIQTSSKFHWEGRENVSKELEEKGDLIPTETRGPYSKPYRWPGTEWMWDQIDDYEKDYPNLVKQDANYPTPDYLRSIIKVGNIGYEGEIDTPTEGSDLIKEEILKDDNRPLYIQVWGGCNTIARALMDVEAIIKTKDNYEALHKEIEKKVILLACGEQDGSYRDYIAEVFPNIVFVKTLQMHCYAYPWLVMPEGESKDSLKADFMKREILNGKSVLASKYCTWKDGNYYPGEEEASQFGANEKIDEQWFGTMMNLPAGSKYDFLSEGDSPTFFALFNWGFRSLEDFTLGGIIGRYALVENESNSKGQPLPIYDVEKDYYKDVDGEVTLQESMWPYVCDVQRDFACRVDWCSSESKGEHAPTLDILEGLDFNAKPGMEIVVNAVSNAKNISFKLYEQASSVHASLEVTGHTCKIKVSDNAKSGNRVVVNVKAQSDGYYRLVHYQTIVIHVK